MKNTKSVVIYILKVIAALGIAGVILSVFSYFYYNPPVHVACEDGATGYKREPDSFWSRYVEGTAHGRIDSNGYNNSYDRDYSEIDILMMGSSQTEALYVDDDKSASYLLNEKFDESNGLCLYNIGMSAHNLVSNVSNLELALEKYSPSKYVILELNTMKFKEERVNDAISGKNVTMHSYDEDSLMFKIQKQPFVKLIYNQYSNYVASRSEDKSTEEDIYVGVEGKRELLSYLQETVSAYNCEAIIFYIPSMSIETDGSLSMDVTEQERAEFSELCEEYGITFVDMCNVFEENYEKNYIVPAGFANTAVAYGHLNDEGHKMIAEELYKVINEMEEVQ